MVYVGRSFCCLLIFFLLCVNCRAMRKSVCVLRASFCAKNQFLMYVHTIMSRIGSVFVLVRLRTEECGYRKCLCLGCSWCFFILVTVFVGYLRVVAGISPSIWSYTVYIYGSGRLWVVAEYLWAWNCVAGSSSGQVQQLPLSPQRRHFWITAIRRVGQNHIYTVYIRYSWQENHQIYGHIRCIYIRFWLTLAICLTLSVFAWQGAEEDRCSNCFCLSREDIFGGYC